jgi:hypothetical protein
VVEMPVVRGHEFQASVDGDGADQEVKHGDRRAP